MTGMLATLRPPFINSDSFLMGRAADTMPESNKLVAEMIIDQMRALNGTVADLSANSAEMRTEIREMKTQLQKYNGRFADHDKWFMEMQASFNQDIGRKSMKKSFNESLKPLLPYAIMLILWLVLNNAEQLKSVFRLVPPAGGH